MNITQGAADVFLTVALCIILKNHKTGFKRYAHSEPPVRDVWLSFYRTNRTLNALIVFTMARGILTAYGMFLGCAPDR